MSQSPIHPGAADFLKSLGRTLSPEALAVVSKLAATPQAGAAFDHLAEDRHAERKAMRAKLDSVAPEFAPEVAKRAKARDTAAARLEKARAELEAAQTAHQIASNALVGLGVQIESLRSKAERDLRDSADQRLDHFDAALDRLLDYSRHIVVAVPYSGGRDNWDRKITKYHSNYAEVAAARAEMVEVRQEIAAAKLLVLAAAEVTGWLQERSLRLAAALAPADLAPPRVDELTGAIAFDDPRTAKAKADAAEAKAPEAAK